MAHVVKYHPSISLLEQYSEGTLAAELALVVAAHLDFCPHCQTLHRDIEADLGCELAMQSAPEANSDSWQQMLNNILAEPAAAVPARKTSPVTPSQSQLVVGQHSFVVPRSLQRLVSKRNKWLTLGGISTAKLPGTDENHLSLLCIETNTQVPLHTHKGLEITLVLSGEMVDEMGQYAAGDLIINTPDHTHTPKNIAGEPCLCLSVLTAPLEFKQGLTRLLNPLQRFFY
ncbi:ChrR family anti-sigma-E factor [Rheinheimera sp.]|uniref:ChrR family anti-sigma-E factor n=1 Tax=Rheinheimera sp. TaxID=1869214 RepID=UPI0027B8E308|nr:ChrR family anti-sigma-E factor [Rheinheimera sp.]